MTHASCLRRFIKSVMAVTAVCATISCDHKDLCFDHPDHALRSQTRIEADYNRVWEIGRTGTPQWQNSWSASFGIDYMSLVPPVPAGLCMNAYSANGTSVTSHIPAKGGIVEMTAGNNELLFFNDDTEYIIFDRLNASVSAKATTRTRTRSSYSGNPFYKGGRDNGEEERTVTPPDFLFGHYIEHYDQLRLVQPPLLQVRLQPLVYTYLIRYEFDGGIEYVGLARGALAGMAESVFLYDGHTGPEQATILYDCTVEPWGVQAVVNSFGVPDYSNPIYPSSRAGSFALNLEVRLRNGKTFSFNFDISDQMAGQPHGGVIIVRGIRITDEQGNESGSGFDVDIDDWGEFNDIDINL